MKNCRRSKLIIFLGGSEAFADMIFIQICLVGIFLEVHKIQVLVSFRHLIRKKKTVPLVFIPWDYTKVSEMLQIWSGIFSFQGIDLLSLASPFFYAYINISVCILQLTCRACAVAYIL